jgi:hypothetical protein
VKPTQMYMATQATNRPRIYLNNDYDAINNKDKLPFMDMAPINTRVDDRDFYQSQSYSPNLNTTTANNPYFQKYDVTQDPRNVTRELQGAVFEERGRKQMKSLVKRNFQHAWVDEDELKKEVEERLRGTQVMRPEQSTFISRSNNYVSGTDVQGGVGAGATHW